MFHVLHRTISRIGKSVHFTLLTFSQQFCAISAQVQIRLCPVFPKESWFMGFKDVSRIATKVSLQ